MEKYYFEEVENLNSQREFLEVIFANTLISARNQASRKSVFQGTILKLYNDKDRNNLISVKTKGIWK